MSKFELSSILEAELSDKGLCDKTFSIKVSSENLKKAIEYKTNQIAKIADLPGFRRGKAPISMIRSRYSELINDGLEDEIIQTALSVKLPDCVNKTAKMSDILSYDYKELEDLKINPESDLSFSIGLGFAPPISLPDYKSLKLNVKKEAVTEEELEKEIERLKENYGRYLDVPEGESAAQDDMLEVDISSNLDLPDDCSTDAKRLSNYQGMLVWLKDSAVSIPGLNKALIGAKTGEIIKLEVEFPVDFWVSDLANKKARYEVKVNKIQKFAPISDLEELSKRLRCQSPEKLKEKIVSSLDLSKRLSYEDECKKQMSEILSEKTPDFELPTNLKNEFLNYEVDAYIRRNIKSEEDQKAFEKNKEEKMKKMEAAANSNLKRFLILRAIAGKENISVSSAELSAEEEAVGKVYNISPAEMRKNRSNHLQSFLANSLLERKTLNFLFAQNIKSPEENKQ